MRIERLPRRRWEDDPGLAQLTQDLTSVLKTPGGTQELRPVQAAALKDIYEVNGLLGVLACGAGKTLLAHIAPFLLEAQRPVLFVPASLRDKALLKDIPTLRRHWKMHPNLAVIGYEELSLAKNHDLLEMLRPDLIVADEVSHLRNLKAGRTRRVARYMKANPATKFIALSGTMTKRSLKDYAHLSQFALKVDYSPLPTTWRELESWADALDEKPDRDVGRIVPVGALQSFCGARFDEKLRKDRPETPREGFQRRLTETPGVVATGENDVAASLQISERKVVPPDKILHMISTMRATWETPNGDEIDEPMTLWRHAREMACGFFQRWIPGAPEPWLKARRAWNKYVRTTLSTNRHGLDTPLQVWNETERNPTPEFEAWKAIKDTFEPNSVPQWESDFLVVDAVRWLHDKNSGGGIVWVEHTAVGEAIARKSGFPYFGGGAKASREILFVKGPIIASVHAHKMGKDLQDRWFRNYITSPMPNGLAWEQAISRTHRSGQPEDTVFVEVPLFCEEQRNSFRRAKNDAAYIEQTTGSKQRLCFADITFRV